MKKKLSIKNEKSINQIVSLGRGNTSVTERKEKNPESIRKFSQERNKAIMQQLSELRKMSQPGRCYSQRYEDVEDSLADRKMKESSTDRKKLSKKS